MVFSGTVQPDYVDIVRNMNLKTEVGERKRLTLEEYEMLHENKMTPSEPLVDTKDEFILVSVDTGTESHGERRYTFNE